MAGEYQSYLGAHICTVMSLLPEAMDLPSGDHATV